MPAPINSSVWCSGPSNAEGDHSTNALLVETNFTLADRDTWFGRLEFAGKTAHDLDLHGVDGDKTFTVAKLPGGYTRYLRPWMGVHHPSGYADVCVRDFPRSLTSAWSYEHRGIFSTGRRNSAGGAGLRRRNPENVWIS